MAFTPQQDLMNRALDGLLDDAAQAVLNALLDGNPQEAQRFKQLNQVDGLLRHPPLVAAPDGLPQAVMAAIRAGQHEAYARPRLLASPLVLGLTLGTVIALPLLFLALLAVSQILADPGGLIALLEGLIQALGTVATAAERLLCFLGSLIAAYPMVPALLVTVIPIVMLWGWLIWFLQQRNRPPTITIKVQSGSA